MMKLTPESGAAPDQCVHRWQQHAVVSTTHCHRHSHRHQHPAGTVLSPQSHQCSTEKTRQTQRCMKMYIHIGMQREAQTEDKNGTEKTWNTRAVGKQTYASTITAKKKTCMAKPYTEQTPSFPRGRAESTAFIKTSLCSQTPLVYLLTQKRETEPKRNRPSELQRLQCTF